MSKTAFTPAMKTGIILDLHDFDEEGFILKTKKVIIGLTFRRRSLLAVVSLSEKCKNRDIYRNLLKGITFPVNFSKPVLTKSSTSHKYGIFGRISNSKELKTPNSEIGEKTLAEKTRLNLAASGHIFPPVISMRAILFGLWGSKSKM
uniref:Uncharacterized protein n=1 Tax=Vespula pensylvanica TaxID=30213 RepID=A0A834JLM6_VESPE|nr:hypothetical protein H0235_018255 [Vespula pensylvanica]